MCYPRSLKKRKLQYAIKSTVELPECAIELDTETRNWRTHEELALGHPPHTAHSGDLHGGPNWNPKLEQNPHRAVYCVVYCGPYCGLD